MSLAGWVTGALAQCCQSNVALLLILQFFLAQFASTQRHNCVRDFFLLGSAFACALLVGLATCWWPYRSAAWHEELRFFA